MTLEADRKRIAEAYDRVRGAEIFILGKYERFEKAMREYAANKLLESADLIGEASEEYPWIKSPVPANRIVAAQAILRDMAQRERGDTKQ